MDGEMGGIRRVKSRQWRVEWRVEWRAESKVSVRKRRKSQWRPVTRQVRSFLGRAMHRCAICKSPLAKNYTLFGTASRLCRALLSESLVMYVRTVYTFDAYTRPNATPLSTRILNACIRIVRIKIQMFLAPEILPTRLQSIPFTRIRLTIFISDLKCGARTNVIIERTNVCRSSSVIQALPRIRN